MKVAWHQRESFIASPIARSITICHAHTSSPQFLASFIFRDISSISLNLLGKRWWCQILARTYWLVPSRTRKRGRRPVGSEGWQGVLLRLKDQWDSFFGVTVRVMRGQVSIPVAFDLLWIQSIRKLLFSLSSHVTFSISLWSMFFHTGTTVENKGATFTMIWKRQLSINQISIYLVKQWYIETFIKV